MINVQDLLNELYYKHGYHHDTTHDGTYYNTEIINLERPYLTFWMKHPHLSDCAEVKLKNNYYYDRASHGRYYKTLNGVINRIKKIESK
ncbi:hypothetical protein SYYB1_30 [Bacillus phage vB_BaeroP_SYYB1]|uniref:Uncharacterized protein n=1 Tax=Bacillus phage vB_BaeroP_SYYB1 TaxID=2980552 RepID=A0A977SM30_9CAUD|nr:hypothetical protein SYYB1_30 [Bacillus phage vB_BaeroP_SYYB1]